MRSVGSSDVLPTAPGMFPLVAALRRLPSGHRLLSVHRPSTTSFLPRSCLPRSSLLAQRFNSSSSTPSFSSRIPLSTTSEPASNTMMDDKTKQHYLADSPPTVVRLEIKSHFDSLKDGKLRKYAHYLSRFVSPGLSTSYCPLASCREIG